MEKNILNDIEDENDNDLNKAQLSLHNDDSLIIEEEHNLTTPLNYRSTALENEELIFKNHNHPHNFSCSSISNFNLTHFHTKTYLEENNQFYQQNMLTPEAFQGEDKNNNNSNYNNTLESPSLSLSGYNNENSHNQSFSSRYTLNSGNSACLNNNYNNTTFNHLNPNNLNNQYLSNHLHNNSNYFYQANSFCLDQQNNPMTYTNKDEYINSKVN